MNTKQTETQAQSEPQVHSSAWLDVLRFYWNDRYVRKLHSATKAAHAGDYATALKETAEAEATKLCLQDLETESTSNAELCDRSGKTSNNR